MQQLSTEKRAENFGVEILAAPKSVKITPWLIKNKPFPLALRLKQGCGWADVSGQI